MEKYDVAVVGAGIVGLAIAYTAAKSGKKVAVFERNSQSLGASVRNFGLVWPLGQPPGPRLERALRSRAVWLELSEKAGIKVRQNGSLTLAYHEDEAAVLEEFFAGAAQAGYNCELIAAEAVPAYSQAVKPEGLRCALYSKTECTVSPRQALPQLAAYLESLGVSFYWGRSITHIEQGHVSDFYEVWPAERVFICGGQDFETLYPRIFRESGITRCKLQMMRTVAQPAGWDLGASLCAGLTLRHYENFAHCPSLAAVTERFDRENPFLREWGIHVLLSQNDHGELVIGDSHEYGWDVQPFDREDINREILKYLNQFAHFPNSAIAETWHGIYPKVPGIPELVMEVEPNVWIVNGLSGAGMTLSFGLAQEIVQV